MTTTTSPEVLQRMVEEALAEALERVRLLDAPYRARVWGRQAVCRPNSIAGRD